jgi:hypothetical protein
MIFLSVGGKSEQNFCVNLYLEACDSKPNFVQALSRRREQGTLARLVP